MHLQTILGKKWKQLIEHHRLNATTAVYITATLPRIINQHNILKERFENNFLTNLEGGSAGLIPPGHSRNL